MKTVTSITTHATAEGIRLSITYSDISESGEIIDSNIRVNRIIVDTTALEHVNAMNEYAKNIIDSL